jgi:Flp pilus assembly protein TadG
MLGDWIMFMANQVTKNNVGRSRPAARYRGVAIVYVAVIMVALMGLCSLAVDFAHMNIVKNELHLAADAAAQYGAMGLPNGSAAAIANAITGAADNKVDGSPMVLLASDVQVGNWDTTQSPNFSTARLPQNAVHVTCARTASRGTATKLLFASVPAGATRLFIGNMDAYEWSNDVGSFSITIHNASTIKIVQ